MQAAKTPNRIAAVYQGQSITYEELNRKSNQLAHLLIEKGIKPEDIVGIMVERSLEMIIGIIGILKSGGAYLPLLPEYPEERFKYISEQSGMKILLTQSSLAESIDFEEKIISIDDASLYYGDSTNPDAVKDSSSLAYVFYTSGSTGKPKGVMIEHKNVMSLISLMWKSVYKEFDTPKNLGLFHPFIFDLSVETMFSSLLFGHTLHIIPENVRAFGRSLTLFCKEHNIEILGLTPSYLNMLIKTGLCTDKGLNLKLVNVGGEALRYETVNKFLDLFNENPPVIINNYGPTECTIMVSTYRIENQQTEKSGNVPIGLPLENTRLYILNKDLSPIPVGETGELYIGGECVGRGYITRPDLTAERFIPNPFVPGERIYRTG
ncbi:MAG TPA: amino acid adenylation domain-containing protein, partial [Ruminiclostridium sp.]|nr:amino acid adenylation domain-containing protein [Ruminiclostridium sp.]